MVSFLFRGANALRLGILRALVGLMQLFALPPALGISGVQALFFGVHAELMDTRPFRFVAGGVFGAQPAPRRRGGMSVERLPLGEFDPVFRDARVELRGMFEQRAFLLARGE